jgi:hypothetical protein
MLPLVHGLRTSSSHQSLWWATRQFLERLFALTIAGILGIACNYDVWLFDYLHAFIRKKNIEDPSTLTLIFTSYIDTYMYCLMTLHLAIRL